MYITTQTVPAIRYFGVERGIKMLAEAGFDGVDFTMTEQNSIWLDRDTVGQTIKQAKSAMKESGLLPMQAHAPFPGYRFGDEDYNLRLDRDVRQSIKTAGELGVPVIVVHPIYCPGYNANEQMEWNLEYYNSLAQLAREFGVKIALENMWGVDANRKKIPNVCSLSDEFSRYYDQLDPGVFACCLDLGHFPLVGESTEHAILTMGHRIGALHVHDNDFIEDSHLLPYSGKMDWKAVTDALADVGYSGVLTFEVDGYMNKVPPDLLPSALKYLHDIGKSLVSNIERNK